MSCEVREDVRGNEAVLGHTACVHLQTRFVLPECASIFLDLDGRFGLHVHTAGPMPRLCVAMMSVQF